MYNTGCGNSSITHVYHPCKSDILHAIYVHVMHKWKNYFIWHSCTPYLTTTPQDYCSYNNTSSCHRHHYHLRDHHYCHHHHCCCHHHGHWLSPSSLHVVPFSNVANRTIVVTTAVVITNHYVTQNNVEEQHKSSYGFPHDSCKYHELVFLFLRCMRMHLKQSFLKLQKLFIMKRETDICRRQM